MTPSPSPFQQNEPVPPRRLLSGWIRYPASLGTCVLFGLIIGSFDTWPEWAFYGAKLVVAVLIGLLLGYVQERPRSVTRQWRALRWRFIWQQTLSWSAAVVVFLGGLNASKQPHGWLTFFIAAPLLLAIAFASDRLTSTFRCPHCGHRFFKAGLSSSASNLWAFGQDKLSNTHCEHCNWPLWKPTEAP